MCLILLLYHPATRGIRIHRTLLDIPLATFAFEGFLLSDIRYHTWYNIHYLIRKDSYLETKTHKMIASTRRLFV